MKDAQNGQAIVPSCGIHIGMPRTGTTSIQNTLATNRPALEALGLRYVVATGTRLDANNLVRRLARRSEDNADDVARALDQLRPIPGTQRGQYVLSSELLYNLGVEPLFEVFDGFPGFDTRIVVYLRRQDMFLESIYCQMAKVRVSGPFQSWLQARLGFPDYAGLLERLAATGAQVIPRLYEKPALTGGETVSDFLSLLGRSKAQLPHRPPAGSRNASLPLKRLELVQAFLEAGLPAPHHTRLGDLVGDVETCGPVRFLTKAERLEFLGHVARSNEVVRERWFPKRDSLFDLADLSDDAPEFQIAEGFRDSDMAEIRAFLAHLARTVSGLKSNAP